MSDFFTSLWSVVVPIAIGFLLLEMAVRRVHQIRLLRAEYKAELRQSLLAGSERSANKREYPPDIAESK